MATPRKKHKKWDSDETKRLMLKAVAMILKESGYQDLEVMKIMRRIGKSKGLIGHHYKNLNELLKTYIQQTDYWPPLFERFNLDEPVAVSELQSLFTSLMQDNLKMFKSGPEMQKIILWQISEDRPMLRKISEDREVEGAKLLNLTNPHFVGTGVNFKAIIALLLGGTYYLVLHSATNKSTVCGIDLNWEHDEEEVLQTIAQIIGWAFEAAAAKKAS